MRVNGTVLLVRHPDGSVQNKPTLNVHRNLELRMFHQVLVCCQVLV